MSSVVTGSIARQAGNDRGWDGVSLGALALGVVLLTVLFLPEFRTAIEIWNASTAYGHCYLILPMSAYLLWDRRALIRQSSPVAEFRWLPLALPIVAAWLLADRLGIMEGRQLAAIAAYQLLFLSVLGWRLYWQLSGPLLFLFFMVPFGAFITPTLQRFTADFTVLGLDLLGIPHYADNFIIETPAGTFLVAEACAGLRFLIAAVAFGVFYALLTYRSFTRRALYIALAVVVPIVANGFRAFGIVYLGQLLGSAEAAAADHVIYGWIFFSIVMLLLVAVGQPFREATVVAADIPAPTAHPSRRQPALAALASVLCIAVGPLAVTVLDASARAEKLHGLLDWTAPEGCTLAADPASASGLIATATLDCGGLAFRVQAKTYPARSTARAIVSDRRQLTGELVAEDSAASRIKAADPSNGDWTLVQTTEPDSVIAFADWIDGAPSRGGLAARLAQARGSVLGADHQPVLLTVSAAVPGRVGSAERHQAIAIIERIVAAQHGLDAQVARLSRVAGR